MPTLLQVAAGHDGLEDLVRVRIGHVGLGSLVGRIGVVGGAEVDALGDLGIAVADLDEFQLAGALQGLDGRIRIADAGQFNDDAVVALQLDRWVQSRPGR